jgi:hypothetical protein
MRAVREPLESRYIGAIRSNVQGRREELALGFDHQRRLQCTALYCTALHCTALHCTHCAAPSAAIHPPVSIAMQSSISEINDAQVLRQQAKMAAKVGLLCFISYNYLYIRHSNCTVTHWLLRGGEGGEAADEVVGVEQRQVQENDRRREPTPEDGGHAQGGLRRNKAEVAAGGRPGKVVIAGFIPRRLADIADIACRAALPWSLP